MRKKGPVVRRVEHPKFPIDFFEHCQMLQYNEIEVKEEGEWEEGRERRRRGEEEGDEDMGRERRIREGRGGEGRGRGGEGEGECKGGREGEMGGRGKVIFHLQYSIL